MDYLLICSGTSHIPNDHDDVIKSKDFPCHWPFVLEIHWSPVNSPHKGQWRGVFVFSLIGAWTNGWINNRVVGDLIRHRAHYDVTVMVHTTSDNYLGYNWWLACDLISFRICLRSVQFIANANLRNGCRNSTAHPIISLKVWCRGQHETIRRIAINRMN